jgi:hypothetical protein
MPTSVRRNSHAPATDAKPTANHASHAVKCSFVTVRSGIGRIARCMSNEW